LCDAGKEKGKTGEMPVAEYCEKADDLGGVND
jgi:hypothetical protein